MGSVLPPAEAGKCLGRTGRYLGIPSYPISSCSSQPSSQDYDSVGNKKCLIGCCPAEAAPRFPGRGWKPAESASLLLLPSPWWLLGTSGSPEAVGSTLDAQRGQLGRLLKCPGPPLLASVRGEKRCGGTLFQRASPAELLAGKGRSPGTGSGASQRPGAPTSVPHPAVGCDPCLISSRLSLRCDLRVHGTAKVDACRVFGVVSHMQQVFNNKWQTLAPLSYRPSPHLH